MQVADQKPEDSAYNKQQSTKSRMNPDLVKKYREVFDNYDKQQQGYVQAKDIPGIMKILSVPVTEQQIVDMLGEKAQKSDSPLVSAKIDFADFLTMIIDKDNEMMMKQELMESFKVFDPDHNGFILVSQMRYHLRTYGIAMPEDQVEDLIKETEPEDGYVKYEKFIDKMLGLNDDKK